MKLRTLLSPFSIRFLIAFENRKGLFSLQIKQPVLLESFKAGSISKQRSSFLSTVCIFDNPVGDGFFSYRSTS
ncbi:hypothetical protein Bca4012_091003 [Brassica carinata]